MYFLTANHHIVDGKILMELTREYLQLNIVYILSYIYQMGLCALEFARAKKH